MVRPGIRIGACMPAGRFRGHASHSRLRLAQEFRRLVRAPRRSRAAHRSTACNRPGETRRASASSRRKSTLYENWTSGSRSCTPDSETPPANGACTNPRARQSVAYSIAGQMAAGRMPADDERRGRAPAAGLRAQATRPRDGTASTIVAIVTSRAEIVVDRPPRPKPGRDERRRDERVVRLVERAPVAAVNEQERAARTCSRKKQVERLLRARPIADVERRTQRLARRSERAENCSSQYG